MRFSVKQLNMFAGLMLAVLLTEGQLTAQKLIVNAADYKSADSPTAGIQEAVDALPAGGGIVYIAPGVYEIRRAVVLRSGVTVRGEGDQSVVVRKSACVQIPLVKDGRSGDRQVSLKTAEGLNVGDEVGVYSDDSHGWWTTHTIIEKMDGSTLALRDTLHHDYLLADKAVVFNFFPAFTADQQKDIVIENIKIDGRMVKKPEFNNEFTVDAIHFRDVSDSRIEQVHVTNWPGDGIGVQIGDNVTVTKCLSEHNLGHGYHPGTGITSGSWTENVGRFNGWDGLFFCHRVRHTYFAGNRFHDNGWSGIGGLGVGGVGGDRYNVVTGNFLYNNAKCGIEMIKGGNNIVTNNVCENNSRGEPGKWPGILVEATYNSIINGNKCFDMQDKDSDKTQAWGILVSGGSKDNVISDNMLSGNIEGGIGGEDIGNNTVSDNLVRETHNPRENGETIIDDYK